MGAYLDRLNAEYDEVSQGVETVLDRAADEGRDVTDDESTQVERDQGRMRTLKSEIERYSSIDREAAQVAQLRATVPPPARTSTRAQEPEYDLLREFPTAADYAITLHRAMVKRDPEAIAAIERATAHQKTSDNPGLIPRPILGPVLNFLQTGRPFINSIGTKALPAGAFDRPVVTQHVAVGPQAAEKDLTASQVLKVDKMPATAKTYAGHLNISRQDIKWSSPGILQIVFDDFAAIYGNVTDADACAQFLAGLNPAVPIASADAAGINAAVFAGAETSLAAGGVFPDTLWVSPDVWSGLGAPVNPNTGLPVFPSLSVTSQSGNPLGLRLVVDPNFAASTMVMGPSRYLEWYEDVDGLMQVAEPDVLGQLVGYAGFAAFLDVNPDAFTAFTLPAPPPPAPEAARSGSGSSKSS
jgi:hypothetical protein